LASSLLVRLGIELLLERLRCDEEQFPMMPAILNLSEEEFRKSPGKTSANDFVADFGYGLSAGHDPVDDLQSMSGAFLNEGRGLALAGILERLSSHRVGRNGDDVHRVDRRWHPPSVRRSMEPHRLDRPERRDPAVEFRLMLMELRDRRRETTEQDKGMTRLAPMTCSLCSGIV